MARRRWITKRQQQAWAWRATAAVVALQAALLLTFLVTPGDPPRSGTLWQLLWAWPRKPQFVPLVALLLFGPPLTAWAWRVRGAHQRWLAAGWGVFLVVGVGVFGLRLWVMCRVLLWKYGAA